MALKGVYLLFKKNQIVYVGKTKNFKNRIHAHRKNYKAWLKQKDENSSNLCYAKPLDDFIFIPIKGEIQRAIIERQLIKKLKPKYNNSSFPYFLDYDINDLVY